MTLLATPLPVTIYHNDYMRERLSRTETWPVEHRGYTGKKSHRCDRPRLSLSTRKSTCHQQLLPPFVVNNSANVIQYHIVAAKAITEECRRTSCAKTPNVIVFYFFYFVFSALTFTRYNVRTRARQLHRAGFLFQFYSFIFFFFIPHSRTPANTRFGRPADRGARMCV